MISARLSWYDAGKKIPARYGLMAFDLGVRTFGLTEAGEKHRVSGHLIEGAGDLILLHTSVRKLTNLPESDFIRVLTRDNHTVE